MDRCPQCDEVFEAGYSVCWRCGTSADGAPPAEGFVPDAAPPASRAPVDRKLNCLRCGEPMVLSRRMKFHEGSRTWPFVLGDVGELLVNRESFDVHACASCGKVEFFLA